MVGGNFPSHLLGFGELVSVPMPATPITGRALCGEFLRLHQLPFCRSRQIGHNTSNMKISKIKRALKKKKRVRKITPDMLLDTGSTLLNIACTGRHQGGLVKGHYYLFVGDSSSGKTWFSHAILAAAANNSNFDDHLLIHDDSERGALMDVRKFFGSKLADRIQSPWGTKEKPEYSETVDQMYDEIERLQKEKIPFIWIEDSMDALKSATDEKARSKKKKDGESGGSYGVGKAKANSERLGKIVSRLPETGSILIIISQTRQNIGFGAMFNPKTRSGGDALKFYATLELWTSVKKRIRATIKGKPRVLGIVSLVKVKKNRVQGKERSVDVPILYSAGIDDPGSCIDWLVDEKHWKAGAGKIAADEFDFKGTREKLIQHIENNDLERDLRRLVLQVWNEIEEACAVQRKPRFE